MAESIKNRSINEGDTVISEPFGKEKQIAEVVSVDKSHVKDHFGGIIFDAFVPKINQYIKMLRRSDGSIKRVSTIDPKTGEIVYS